MSDGIAAEDISDLLLSLLRNDTDDRVAEGKLHHWRAGLPAAAGAGSVSWPNCLDVD